MSPSATAPVADPLESRFRSSIRASVLSDERTVVLGGVSFSAARLLEAMQSQFIEAYRGWRTNVWIPQQRSIVEACLRDKASDQRFASLKERFASDSVLAFVGSGMSVPFKYPMWEGFLVGLLKWCDGLDEPSLRTILATEGYEAAASAICAKIHRRHWDEQLSSEFSPPSPDMLDTIEAPVHWLPFLSPRAAVTTNYDPILETVYERAGVSFHNVLFGSDLVRFRELKNRSKRCLLKLHGDRENPASRVLTQEEYEKAYAKKSAARRELEMLFQNHSLLFLGCSLSVDRTMQTLRQLSQKDSSMPRHFAFMQRPSSDSDWLKRERFLSDHGIWTIWYSQDHNKALEALLGVLALETGKVDGST